MLFVYVEVWLKSAVFLDCASLHILRLGLSPEALSLKSCRDLHVSASLVTGLWMCCQVIVYMDATGPT